MVSGKLPSTDKPYSAYPLVVQNQQSKKDVLVVQAGGFSKYLGKLDLTFDENGNVVKRSGNPILLDSTIKEDPEIKRFIDSKRYKHDKIAKVTLMSTIFVRIAS